MFSYLKNSKLFFAGFFISLGLLAFGTASAFSCDQFYGSFTATTTQGVGINTIQGLPKVCTAFGLANSVINIIMTLAAIAAVISLMLGGFWYLTAAGNEEQSEKGRKVITSSVIGLVVIIMAFALVRIAVNLLTLNTGTANPPAAQSTGGTPGTGGTPPANNPGPGTGGGTGGAPVSSDPANMLSNLTQQDYASYDNKDHLANGINYQRTGSGVTATSAVSSSDKQALGEVRSLCGTSLLPDAYLYKNGQSVAEAQYKNSGSGTWTATLAYSGSATPSDTFQVYVCGNLIPGSYSPSR